MAGVGIAGDAELEISSHERRSQLFRSDTRRAVSEHLIDLNSAAAHVLRAQVLRLRALFEARQPRYSCLIAISYLGFFARPRLN